MKALLLLLLLSAPAYAAEPKNPSDQLPQPYDEKARHWTAKRWYTQSELLSMQRHRIPIDRLDYLEASGGGEGGGAGSGGPGAGSSGATPGTVCSL